MVSQRFVLQVSDRLVSRPTHLGIAPFDPRSNKNVVYFARDAYVVIAYTGLAYLDGRTTDQWIAEKLIGEDVSAWGLAPDGGIGQRFIAGPSPAWFDIGMARQVVRRELIASAQRLPPSQRPHLPRIVIAGWQRGKRLWRPILHLIADEGAGSLYQGAGWAQRHGWQRGMFYLDFTPRNYLLDRIRTVLNGHLIEGRSVEESEKLMGEALRTAAHNSLGIGKDYLAVLLPPPNELRVHTKYAAFSEENVTIPGLYNPYIGPVGYSPWVIAPHRVIPPAVLVGTGSTSGGLGKFALELEGPPNTTGTGPIMSMTSQARPNWPSRRVRSAITSATWEPQSIERRRHQPAIFKLAKGSTMPKECLNQVSGMRQGRRVQLLGMPRQSQT